MKNKINLDEIVNKEEIYQGFFQEKIEEDLEKNSLYFLKKREEEYYPDAQSIEVFGEKLYVLMKSKLEGALLDPNSDDLETLRKARDYSKNELKRMFSKLQLNPNKSNFNKTLDDKYLSSLSMNIIKYPLDIPFKENLKKIGLEDSKIKKCYAQAAAAWLGEPGDLDLFGMVSKLEKISTWSGNSDIVDLSVDNCESGSHYILKADIKKQQFEVQKKAVVSEEYSLIEQKIVNYIKSNAGDSKIVNNAENFIRMFLNLSCLYDKNKPLPLK